MQSPVKVPALLPTTNPYLQGAQQRLHGFTLSLPNVFVMSGGLPPRQRESTLSAKFGTISPFVKDHRQDVPEFLLHIPLFRNVGLTYSRRGSV